MSFPQSNRIATEIAEAIQSEPFITDIQLREGAPIFIKSPKGLTRLSSAPLSEQELANFFGVVAPAKEDNNTWRARLKGVTNDFNTSWTLPDVEKRLRINGFQWSGDLKLGAAIRCQPKVVPAMETLGVPEIMKEFLNGKGLVLVTGPTGAGKSTTLAAAFDYLNNMSKASYNIITIEDPIEYEISSKNSLITQREVGTGPLDSMSDGVKSALRQNPDVIGIGELRDRETAAVALRAAASGHLVLASMHTNSAKDTAEAIINFFEGEEVAVKAQMLSSVLQGIISQQLVPTTDKKAFLLVTEVLIVNHAVRTAIKDRNFTGLTNLMDVASGDSRSYTLNTELAAFVGGNQITKEAALLASYDPEGLRKRLGIIHG